MDNGVGYTEDHELRTAPMHRKTVTFRGLSMHFYGSAPVIMRPGGKKVNGLYSKFKHGREFHWKWKVAYNELRINKRSTFTDFGVGWRQNDGRKLVLVSTVLSFSLLFFKKKQIYFSSSSTKRGLKTKRRKKEERRKEVQNVEEFVGNLPHFSRIYTSDLGRFYFVLKSIALTVNCTKSNLGSRCSPLIPGIFT